jgi:hypothetical protein
MEFLVRCLIATHGQALQVAFYPGLKWLFLYVSYAFEDTMQEARTFLQEATFVQTQRVWPYDVDKERVGGAVVEMPLFLTLDEFNESFFTLLVSGYDDTARVAMVQAEFSKKTDLAPYMEVQYAKSRGAFLVNFVDFDDAVAALDTIRPYSQENQSVLVRPQQKMLVLLKVCKMVELHKTKEISVELFRTMSQQMSQHKLSEANILRLMRSTPSIFKEKCVKLSHVAEEGKRRTDDTGPAVCSTAVFEIVRNDKMRALFEKNNFFEYSIAIENESQDVAALFAEFFQCMIFFMYQESWHHTQEDRRQQILTDCIPAATLASLPGSNENEWTPRDFVQILNGAVVRNAVWNMSKTYTVPARASRQIDSRTCAVLVDNHLVNEQRAQQKYQAILMNKKQSIFFAVKSIIYCFNILTLNDNTSELSLDMLLCVIRSSKQILQEFIAMYDRERF